MKIHSKFRQILAFVFLFFSVSVLADAPSQVTNVTATVENETVKLTWTDASSDDDIIVGYRIYYGTNSVQVPEDIYTENPIDTGSETEYIFENLTPDTPYYFAVTALDSIDRESNNYSLEAAAKIETEIEEIIEEPIVEKVETIEEFIDPIDDNTEETIIEEVPIEEPVTEIITEEITEEIFQESAPDTTAPTKAKNVSIKVNNNDTTISWTRSLDSDVSSQKVAIKEANDINWSFENIDKFSESKTIETKESKTYMVKIITIDNALNESESEVKTFSTTLAESGPASNLAIIIAIAFIGLLLFSVKRKA